MTIKREDIDRRIVEFSDIASRRRLPPVHPGEILRDEFLTPMGISVYALANAIKVPRSRANDIVLGRRAVTTDTAMRLGAISACPRNSGSICRHATISTLPTAPCGAKSSGKSLPETQPDRA